MPLRHALLAPLEVPLHVPFVTALRRVDSSRDVVLRLEDDAGRAGWGSAPPTLPLTGETTEGLLAFLGEVAIPWLASRSRDGAFDFDAGFESSRARIDAEMKGLAKLAAHNSGARGAVESALLDLAARAAGEPLFHCLAGAGSGAALDLVTDVTLSIAEPSAMASRLRILAGGGFRAFKTKLSGDADVDGTRLRRLREEALRLEGEGVRVRLRLDANEAFAEDDALRFFSRAEKELGSVLECVEQPVARGNFAALGRVASALNVPVLADESAMSTGDLERLLAEDACDGIVVKLAKAGGPLAAQRWMETTLAAGKTVLASCMLECHASLGAMAAATAAVLLSVPGAGDRVLLDLDGAALLARSPFEGGLRYDGARLFLPEGPGSGIVGFTSRERHRFRRLRSHRLRP